MLDFLLIGRSVRISAKTGLGIESLLEEISKALPEKTVSVKLFIPFSEARIVNEIRQHGTVETEEYTENGIKITACAKTDYIETVKEYIIGSES